MSKAYYEANKEKCAARVRIAHLKAKYGITQEDYAVLLEAQGGKCAICDFVPTDKQNRLCVDHDHKTGKVRGLLCARCNYTLGMCENGWLHNALAYLEVANEEEKVNEEMEEWEDFMRRAEAKMRKPDPDAWRYCRPSAAEGGAAQTSGQGEAV